MALNNISTYLFKDLCNYIEPSRLMQRRVESGKLGSKSGKGFYNWPSEALIYFLERDVQNKQ